MPRKQLGLKVFIASPANLADERSAFQAVLERINRDLAHAEDINFMAAGQEFALAGVGRAQALIDEQVRDSDYLVVVLWDKFGSSPGGETPYASGTEEEFFVGLESLSDAEAPMKNICVLFKGVADRQLADPGANLQRVLDFKHAIEETQGLLYSTFDSIDEFKDLLRTHFSSWTRDWSGGRDPAKAQVNLRQFRDIYGRSTADPGAVVNDDKKAILELVRLARESARRGRNSTAEELFAKSIAGAYVGEAYTQYVRFVRKRGRLAHAETLANQFIELAQDADDLEGECEGLANLALVSRLEGKHQLCLDRLERALEVANEWVSRAPTNSDELRRALATKAFLINNISLTLSRLPGHQHEILPLLTEARAVEQQAGDRQGEAFALKNIGSHLYRMGQFDDAELNLRAALTQFEEVKYESGQSSTLGALAEIYEARGDFELALEKLDASTHVSRQRTPSRLAANHSVMVRVLISLDRVNDARAYVEECVRIGSELGTTESVAAGLQAEAHLALADGDAQAVENAAQEAARRYAEVGNTIGMAASGLMLARARLLADKTSDVTEILGRASDHLMQTPHFVLQAEIDSLRIRG